MNSQHITALGSCLTRTTPFILCILLTVIATNHQSLSAPRTDPDAILERLQEKYNTLTSFQADFTQRYYARVLDQIRVEKGTIYLMKPGKMRWVYKSPTKKLFIADGEASYFYVPEDNQVVVEAVEANEATAFPFLFLGGDEKIKNHFEVLADEPAERNQVRLKLVPKAGDPQYQELSVAFERRGLVLQQIEFLDQNENETTISFSNVAENPALDDELFRFLIPPGVEVLRSGQESSSLLTPSRVE